MASYIVRRILLAIPVVFVLTLVSFLALRLAPGDPITARISPFLLAQMDPATIANRRHELGLDQPILVQYLRWLQDVLQGDLGYSVITGAPTVKEIGPRIGPTVLLMGTAMFVAVVVGVPLGVISAVRQYSLVDYGANAFSLLMIVVPSFVLGLACIYVFGVFIPILPTRGMVTLGVPFNVVDLIRHLILPAAILGFGYAAPLVRYTRASMLEVLNSEYVTTATAKGLVRRHVLVRHTFRNALLPVITILGLYLPELVAGAVVIEQIFSWPGMGSLAVRAANDRDPAILMGVLLLVSITVLVSSLVVDIAYAAADPRVRLGETAG
jgi:peptide/nickel transport system permease protein